MNEAFEDFITYLGPHQAADDSGSRRTFQPVRVADGNDEIAYLDTIGVAECQRRQPRQIDLEDRNVSADVQTYKLGPGGPSVMQADADGNGIFDDVMVSADQPLLGVEDDP